MTLPGFTECEKTYCNGPRDCVGTARGCHVCDPDCPDCGGTGLQPDPAVVEACLPAVRPFGGAIMVRAVLMRYAREVQP